MNCKPFNMSLKGKDMQQQQQQPNPFLTKCGRLHGLDNSIMLCNESYLVIDHLIPMVWHIVFLGHPQLLSNGLSSILSTFFMDASEDLLHTCTNHLRRDSTIFSTIWAASTFSLLTPFIILFCLAWPHIHYGILISATLTIFGI